MDCQTWIEQQSRPGHQNVPCFGGYQKHSETKINLLGWQLSNLYFAKLY